MKTSAVFASVLFAALAGGCAANKPYPAATEGQIKEIIVCRLKDPNDIQRVMAVANDFAKLPDLLDVYTGPWSSPAEANRKSEHGFSVNVAFVLTFANLEKQIKTIRSEEYKRLKQTTLRDFAIDGKDGVTTETVVLQDYLVSKKYTEETTAADLQRRSAAARDLEFQRSRAK